MQLGWAPADFTKLNSPFFDNKNKQPLCANNPRNLSHIASPPRVSSQNEVHRGMCRIDYSSLGTLSFGDANAVLVNTVQSLARTINIPGFPWKNLLVGLSLAQFTFETYLVLRQYSVLERTKPPKALENIIDRKKFDTSQVCWKLCPSQQTMEDKLADRLILSWHDYRTTVVRKRMSALLPASTRNWRISQLFTTMFSPTCGLLPVLS